MCEFCCLLSGVFILNFVCRYTDLRDQVVRDLHTVFSELYNIGFEGEVNEIWPQSRYQSATEDKKSVGTLRTLFESSIVKLQKLAKSQSHSWDPSLDLCQLVLRQRSYFIEINVNRNKFIDLHQFIHLVFNYLQ